MTNFHCAYIAAKYRAEREQKIRNAGKLLLLTATIVSAIVWVIA
jgi:hypothetical protein